APLLGGREPRFQAAAVWFLLASLVVIVAGSFTGEWLAINRVITDATRNFWFGHQGYEYVDLGRFWQIYLFIGLLLWVALALRGRMGLVRVSVATTSVLVATIVFLGGGVLGTFHHLYWSGTPISVVALGSVFSALEVVPLMVVGFEAYSRARHEGLFDWQKT